MHVYSSMATRKKYWQLHYDCKYAMISPQLSLALSESFDRCLLVASWWQNYENISEEKIPRTAPSVMLAICPADCWSTVDNSRALSSSSMMPVAQGVATEATCPMSAHQVTFCWGLIWTTKGLCTRQQYKCRVITKEHLLAIYVTGFGKPTTYAQR